jgi:hypothetical protein
MLLSVCALPDTVNIFAHEKMLASPLLAQASMRSVQKYTNQEIRHTP